MRILIIGGTGFIGPHLVRMLVKDGHEVTVCHRGRTEAQFPEQVRNILDSRAGIPVVDFPQQALDPAPDAVVHMIAMGEADARCASRVFVGRCKRVVWISSGDVYRAYGRFTGSEPGEVERGLLSEDSPLRAVMYPYRQSAQSTTDPNYFYDKILVEKAARELAEVSVVLRLPKVYGPGGNADLATVHRFRHHAAWRWTHGYVENVAAAVALAVTHPAAAGRVYNVGEEHTPTVGERLARLPDSDLTVAAHTSYNFEQHLVYDTSRIRRELGFREVVSYEEGIRRTMANPSTARQPSM
jgi:nucleoside-diphosphate-sugar epimerase